EEAVRERYVPRLGLAHDERLPVTREVAQESGLRAGDVDGRLTCVRRMVQVEDLVGEALQGAFGQRDESHRQIQARQPRRGRDQVADVVQVALDLGALTDTSH